MTRVLLAFGALCIVAQSFAQPFKYRFHSYRYADGLPSESVNAITEDAFGFMWIGTSDGLCRFDSYEFKVYDRNHGLQNPHVTTFWPCKNGDLWVGTTTGLFYFNGRTEVFENVSAQKNLPNAYISRIIEDDAGNLWIGTSEGLLHYATPQKVFTHYQADENRPDGLPSNKIFDLLLSNKGELWISSSREGLSVKTGNNSFKSFKTNPNDPHSISSNVLRKMLQLPDGKIIVGTAESGLNIFDPVEEKFERHSNNPTDPFSLSSSSAFSFLLDKNGNVWVGTWSHGLDLFDTAKGTARHFIHNPNNPFSIPNNSIQCLMQSSSGDIWIGTSAGGLARLNLENEKFIRFQHQPNEINALRSNYVKSVYEDSDHVLWIGTHQKGLHRYDPKTEQIISFLEPRDDSRDALARATIWSITSGANNTLWLGTSRGLANFNKVTGHTIFHQADETNAKAISGNNVLKVFNDNAGSIWAGTWYGGLSRFDIKTKVFEQFKHNSIDSTSLPSNNVVDIWKDLEGGLWILTEEGLSRFDSKGKSFTHHGNGGVMMSPGSGEQILVTTKNGIEIFDTKSRKFAGRIDTSDGLSSDLISSVLVDRIGRLWAASDKGIDVYDPSTKKVIHLDMSHGLAGNDNEARACYKTELGKLYFGGTSGLTLIDPADVMESSRTPKILLTELLLLNKIVTVSDSSVLKSTLHSTEQVKLNYSDYVVAFQFAAVDFSRSQKAVYTYKLEGFDKTWITTSSKDRKAVYTNLPNGDYQFLVKLATNEKVATSLAVSVIPPWWKTLWARLIFLVCAALGILLFINIRIRTLKNQKQRLELLVKERTLEVTRQKEKIELQAEDLKNVNLQKTKLFSIIAHDLRSPINSLKGIAHLLDPSILSKDELSSFRENIKAQISTIDSLMSNVLAWAKGQLEGEIVRPEEFDIQQVLKETLDVYSPIAQTKNILLVNLDGPSVYAMADINQIRAVVRNLVSNAIKFTRQFGAITLAVSHDSEYVRVSVSDNGLGISSEQTHRLFDIQTNTSTAGTGGEKGVGLGLLLVKEFVEKNGGRIEVESKVGEGTTFTFSVKKSLRKSSSGALF